jgi:hypothetical protein
MCSLAEPSLAPIMPRWLKSCRDLSDFWGMIKQKFGSYQERRDWLRAEFEPLFDLLEGRTPRTSGALVQRRRDTVKHPTMALDDGVGWLGPRKRCRIAIPAPHVGGEMVS